MCFFYCLSITNYKNILFFILVGIIITLYQQFCQIRVDVKEVKTKSEIVSQIDITLKNIKRMVDRLRDDVKEYESGVRSLKSEIYLYSKDKTGLVDFAYGGLVISTRNTEVYEFEGLEMFGFRLCGQNDLEKRILEKSVMPGDCWPIKGNKGFAVIQLIDEICVTKVSLEHAPKELIPNGTLTSAPKDFSLWGLQDVFDSGNETPHFFGQFVFNIKGPQVQTFVVQNKSDKTFKLVEIKIHSNHGHPNFTCIYRVRIHGHKT